MKASEMTNEELAKAIEKRVAEAASNWDFAPTLREAAARLRKIDTFAAINERQDIDNAKLRANLIVAVDSLTIIQRLSFDNFAINESKKALDTIRGKKENE